MSTATHSTRAVLHGPRVALTAVGAWFHSAMRAVLVARMSQVYHTMNDAQLAQIGLSRADIPDAARKLSGLSR